MKKKLLFTIFTLLPGVINSTLTYAQSSEANHLFRFYEDNDFLNIRGAGTDRAYTNGVRLDLFYIQKKPSPLIDQLMPKAGKNSRDIYGWSVMQMMVTPSNLTIPDFQANDYPYSGALFVTHSLASYNSEKKFDLQTEILFGVRGPASFARQTQVWIHQVINDETPMGWKNQINTKALFNVNFTAEKQLASSGKVIEIIGGTQISAGTLTNSVAIYPLIRIGKFSSYFNGFISQYSNLANPGKMHVYFFMKPKITFVASNALIHGELDKNAQISRETKSPYSAENNQFVGSIDYGFSLSSGAFGISYTQKPTMAYAKGLYGHNVGNISIYFSW
ncbi:lipid A deacylase LpxR family protein [Dyadobacter sp. CY345]|uniref:lipid A deacylase LpxR family protein n=1 Tax=Dyadobacter sp. CY345 TaxID=2909335 RepID=UPI001F1BD0CE|nr:lipid A deacylase LpxR family protein [Dyadobacter sp. CY345]MCF2443594.1 lipid A deacylase LpxR family protein [Dyadobacter sp. CY345]